MPAAAPAADCVNSRRLTIGVSPRSLDLAVGRPRRGFRRQGAEARLVRTVTLHAQQVGFGAVPVAGAAAMNAGPPVAVLLAVALAAEAVRFFERHMLAAGQVQDVAVVGVVTVQAPAVGLIVLENDVGVHGRKLTPVAVRRHTGMAVGARAVSY